MSRQAFFKNKKILIFGGTGSWGNELVRQLASTYQPAEIRIFSRGEHKQVEMRQLYKGNSQLIYIIGDVRDQSAVDEAMRGADIVFNLAALKHVPVCEENVWETVQTNIHGPHNIVRAALKHAPLAVIQVSTDKAVDPLNTYGFTKGVAEKLMTSAHFIPTKPERTKFVCVRGGNVLGTNGSVIPLFKHLISHHNRVAITDKAMSRFFMRVQDAIGLVLEAAYESIGGEIFVMKMPGAKIIDLAEVMIEALGDKTTKIDIIGVRPGEKMYEVLVSRNEAPATIIHGQYFIILPEVQESFDHEAYATFKRLNVPEYNSMTTHQIDKKAILELLKKDDWLTSHTEQPYSTVFSPYKES